jgi:beta-glucosidase
MTASPPSATVGSLVARLTLDDKALLLEGVNAWNTNGVERLGVRRLFVTDGPHGVRKVRENAGAFGLADAEPSTSFPTSSALAKTWNPGLARDVGAAIGRESAALGVDVLLAPGVNIMRSPLCGRNFEYYSEDPLVSGVFGAAFVAGVQSEGVAASVKHFAANSNEDFRFTGDSVVDERALREIYLRAFERIV